MTVVAGAEVFAGTGQVACPDCPYMMLTMPFESALAGGEKVPVTGWLCTKCGCSLTNLDGIPVRLDELLRLARIGRDAVPIHPQIGTP